MSGGGSNSHVYNTGEIFSDSKTGRPIILESVYNLEELLALNTSIPSREEGTNIDTISTPKGDFLLCHLATMMDFTHEFVPVDEIDEDGNARASDGEGIGKAYKHAFEAAGAIALAAHHLNEGIGWIVPELTGLPERCPIRFSTEFVDTKHDQGVALGHVIEMTDRPVHKRRPCAFIGATRSTVSIPTAIVTGIRGYPQISPQSTSEQLDDKDQYPLFGRTVPSDLDNAIPIVRYIRENLNATHIVMVHVNNGYGNAFAEDLIFAAQQHTPDLFIEEFDISEEPNAEMIEDVIGLIKRTKFSYVFAALNEEVIDDVMIEAYKQGIAGTGIHNWFFSNSFGTIEDRYFEANSTLYHAYKGIGRMQVSGGHQGMRSFETFACNLRTFKSSIPDLDFFSSLLPQDNQYTNYQGLKTPYLYDENFMDQIPKMADITSPAYEAAIALGLSACDVVMSGKPMTGYNHYEHFKNTTFQGIEGDVRFKRTGTRDPDSSLFAVENELPEPVEVIDVNGTKRIMYQFHTKVTDIYSNGKWENLDDFIFNDGTSVIQNDLTPPDDVVHFYIHTPLKIVAGVMYLLILGLTIRFIVWTEKNKKTRVIRASQPLFLRVILGGIVIFSTAIIPLNIDDRIASIRGCTIACNFFYWLLFLGFAIMFSGLFTKIYRVNQIMNNPQKFRRVKVTVQDCIRPMALIIGVNFVLLTTMTIAAPSEWKIEVIDTDIHGRPTETFGHCTTEEQIPYYSTLGIVNFSALLFSIQQSYKTRKLATEFSESRYIFYAMIGIMVALFQGIPVLVLVRESPDVQDFIKCTLIFVTCGSVLLFMFVPKVKFLNKRLKKTKSTIFKESIRVTGIEQQKSFSQRATSEVIQELSIPLTPSKIAVSGLTNLSMVSGASSGNSSEEEGIKISTLSHTELADQNKLLRQWLKDKNVSMGTMATDDSVSEGSGGSSGMQIITRKSVTELMTENKKLKKLIKNHKNILAHASRTRNRMNGVRQEEKEEESGDDIEQVLPFLNDISENDDTGSTENGSTEIESGQTSSDEGAKPATEKRVSFRLDPPFGLSFGNILEDLSIVEETGESEHAESEHGESEHGESDKNVGIKNDAEFQESTDTLVEAEGVDNTSSDDSNDNVLLSPKATVDQTGHVQEIRSLV